MNFAAITRRIRRCESEVPAQLVLEYAIKEAVEAERNACAEACMRATPNGEMRKAIGDAAHYVACRDAVLARSNALAHQAGAKAGDEAKGGCTGSGAATGSA